MTTTTKILARSGRALSTHVSQNDSWTEASREAVDAYLAKTGKTDGVLRTETTVEGREGTGRRTFRIVDGVVFGN